MLQPDAAEALALLDGLDQGPAKPQQKPRPTQWWDELRTVPELPELPNQASALASLPGQTTGQLFPSTETTGKPAVLWALHVALDAAGIPPCVRRPPGELEAKDPHLAAFITTLADLHWLAKRHPKHRPQLQRMRNVLQGEPDSLQWHRACLWAFQHCRGEPGWLARRLALTDDQRAQTMTMPTLNQSNRRRALPARLETIREQLLTHALDHPDKTGKGTPDALADRRVKLLCLYLLLDRDHKATHEVLQRVYGVQTTVRALTLQLEAIARITGARQLVHGPTRA